MAKVRLLGGKPLLVGGKVALTDDCCCVGDTGACCIAGVCSQLTEEACTTAGGTFYGTGVSCDDVFCEGGNCGGCDSSACGLCFELKLEVGDDFDGDAALITNGATFIEIFISGSGPYTFTAIGPGDSAVVSVGTLFGVWHQVSLKFVKTNSSHVLMTLTVDASSDSATITTSAIDFNVLQVGNIFGGSGGVNRLYRCVQLKGTSEFTFPPDTFDSFTGSASIVDNMLQCLGTGDSYATENLSPDYDPHCCDEYTLALTASSSGTVVAGAGCGVGGFDVDLAASGEGSCPTNCLLECSTEFTSCCGITCEGECGPFNAGVVFRARLVLVGSDYILHLDASFQNAGCLTIETFGGDDLLTDNLGPDPVGTFNYSFDDPNNASVHYTFSVTVFAP